jgi:hypothetical protein
MRSAFVDLGLCVKSYSRLQQIEVHAFAGTGLKSVTIPSSVEVIGDFCFSGCRSLREIIFEAGSRLRQIGDRVFSGTKLAIIEIPSKCEILNGLSLKGVKSVVISSENPFFAIERSLLTSHDGKRLIQFFGSESELLIKREIEVIGRGCFFGCTSLHEVTFEVGSRLRLIANAAFAYSGLTKIAIPSSVEVIEDNCFSWCRSLCEVTFDRESRLIRIGAEVFCESELKKIVIPRGVTVLGRSCFLKCHYLCEVTFEMGSELQEIGESVFYGTDLKRISIPAGVGKIGSECFSRCNSLCEITFEGCLCKFERSWFWWRPRSLRRIRMRGGMSLDNLPSTEECRVEYIEPD